MENPNNQTAIDGIVTDSQGNPLAWATVIFTGDSPSHTDIAALTDEQGRYQYTNLIPGLYKVLVNAEGYSAQVQQIQTIAGQIVSLDFHLNS